MTLLQQIRAEIERRFSEYNHDSNHHIQAAECASILSFLDSLQVDEPEELDEAAEEYINDTTPKYGWTIENAFKAGAKWMAEQGVSKDVTIGLATSKIIVNITEETLNNLDVKASDKVIIQIRKK